MSQRVIITPDENGNNPTVIADLSQNQNMLPVNVSYHEATTIQTHNAVSVAATTSSVPSTWIDCVGYDKLAVTLLNDAATSNTMTIQWSNDGVNRHGDETILPQAGTQRRSAITDIKARYAKPYIDNNDTIAHTMSAWAYLKA